MKKYIAFTFLFLWLVIIFLFSCESAKDSTKTSKSFTKQVIVVVEKITKIDLDEMGKDKVIDKTFKVVRKFAHFFEYFVLAVLLMFVFQYYLEVNIKLVILVCCIGLLYSITDEFHQLFVPGRTGRVVDVLVDFLGICLGSFSYYFIYGKDRKNSCFRTKSNYGRRKKE